MYIINMIVYIIYIILYYIILYYFILKFIILYYIILYYIYSLQYPGGGQYTPFYWYKTAGHDPFRNKMLMP